MPLRDVEKNKAYHKKYHKKWYADPKNAASKKANAKKHRKISLDRNLNYIYQYKLDHPCCKCKDYHPDYIESHPSCLQFHHCQGDKETEVATLARNMVSIKRLQAEIDKCIVVCANCHLRIHEEMRNNIGG